MHSLFGCVGKIKVDLNRLRLYDRESILLGDGFINQVESDRIRGKVYADN